VFAHRIFVSDKGAHSNSEEGLHYLGIELAASVTADLLQGVLVGHGLAIRPVGGDGVVGVDHSEDAATRGISSPTT